MNWKYLIKSIDKGEKSKYKIYALIINEDIDSHRKGDVIYVGITTKSLGNRRSGHLDTIGYSNISIILIENTDNSGRESYYINMFKSFGCNLLNKNNGISENIVKEKPSNEERLLVRKEKVKNYYQENKERIINNMRIYQEKNKERLKEYRRLKYLKSKTKEYFNDIIIS
jgi:hypothetical protein